MRIIKNTFFFFTLFHVVLDSSSLCFAQISIAVGGSLSHSFIAGPSGVCGWGVNGNGQIGDNSTINRTTPVPVSITGAVTKVVAGKVTSLFLKSNGEVWGCGQNEVGQLGLGNRTQQIVPVQIMAGTTFTDIACGSNADHCLLLKNDGKVYAFGRNDDGELGTGPDGMGQYNSNATFGCPPPSVFCHPCTNSGATNSCEWGATANDLIAQPLWSGVCSAVWAGAYSSFFKKTDGTYWASGNNTSGQLGDGTTTTPSTIPSGPVQISTLAANSVSKISAGTNHTLFLKTDGTVWATGANTVGQLGDGTTTPRSTPFQCTGLPAGTYIDIAAGAAYSVFLKSDNTVYVCGDNLYGQLGNGASFPTSNVASPTLLATISNVKAIATGSTSQSITLFLKTDNTLWAAGYNVNGNLGDGTITGGPNNGKSTPVQVSNTAGCLPGILPVELTSFSASCNSGVVKCEWSTASEINNDYFSVERSEDGKMFTEIGIVNGAGNSSTEKKYSFTDESFYSQYTNLYYRLKQTDYDGKSDYFAPVSVSCSSSDEWNLILQNTPAKDELRGTLFSGEEENFQFEIYDLQGRIILHDKFIASKGSTLIKLDIKTFESGIYFVKVFNRKRQLAKKFVKG